VVDGSGPSGLVSEADEPGVVIRQGDILVPAIASRVESRVATPEQIGALIAPGVHLVRVDLAVLDPWFVAGALSSTANTQRAAVPLGGTGQTMRIDIKRLKLPVLPLSEQGLYGAAFRRLATLEAATANLAKQGRQLARSLTEGLIGGTIDPRSVS
jgi:hypothetical protein